MDEGRLTPILGALYGRVAKYDQVQLDRAYLEFEASACGQVLLDTWMVNVGLGQISDLRGAGRHDFFLMVLDAIQEAKVRAIA
jgi:hypothetical protein